VVFRIFTRVDIQPMSFVAPLGQSKQRTLSTNDKEGVRMPTFITIGYGDRAGYEQTDLSIRETAHSHDARLRAGGALMGVAGAPVQVRNHDGAGVRTMRGPFMHSGLPIAGFAVIEAESLEEATQLVSETPCAVAHGVLEIWPLESTP
jgi:hypothetical protein